MFTHHLVIVTENNKVSELYYLDSISDQEDKFADILEAYGIIPLDIHYKNRIFKGEEFTVQMFDVEG
jgi:hypothetical protein